MKIICFLLMTATMWAQYAAVPSTAYPALDAILNAKPALTSGSGAPSSNCTTGHDLYVDTAAGTLYSCTATNTWSKPSISAGISGLASGVATFLGTPSGANFNLMITGGGVQIPQNSKSAAYTTVLTDCMGSIYHPSADTTARTFTIDSNANVAAPIGCSITFVNDASAGVLTIAITTDTLVLAGAGTTGSRTLAAANVATATKVTSTRWVISGTSGLT